jgi:hypothetical protein
MSALFVFVILQACENSNEDTINKSKQGGQVTYPGCKENNLKSTFSESQKPCITIKTIDSNYLKVEHINAEFNCIFDSLTIDCSINGNAINIQENHVNPNALCTCEYDIEYQIGPLEFGKTYSINIVDEASNEISFEFEFTENTLTTYCKE